MAARRNTMPPTMIPAIAPPLRPSSDDDEAFWQEVPLELQTSALRSLFSALILSVTVKASRSKVEEYALVNGLPKMTAS